MNSAAMIGEAGCADVATGPAWQSAMVAAQAVAVKPTDEVEGDAGMDSDTQTKQGEVLVVEDTAASLKLLSDLLRAEGYAVRQARDGELALWSAQSRPPELVLLDVRMPGIDGFEVCRRLKQLPGMADVPVIFLSAQHDTDDKVRGFRAGAVDFIGKPYQAEEVLARTSLHIKLARTQRALGLANLELNATLEQLRSARDEIQRSERLAALGAMVTGVAHELNTPIGNGVLAASTLAARVRAFGAQVGDGIRRSELAQFVDDVQQASELLLRNLDKSATLVSGFKQLACDQSAMQRSSFSLAQLVADVIEPLAAPLQERQVALRVEVAPGIMLDNFPGALSQILSQLVSNAMLHGFADGRAGTIALEARGGADDLLELCVRDNGGGIAASHLERIFDPFFTTKLGQGGCGLGLNIVHNLVCNVLGGSIDASSTPGDTCFLLRFPRQAPQLNAQRERPA